MDMWLSAPRHAPELKGLVQPSAASRKHDGQRDGHAEGQHAAKPGDIARRALFTAVACLAACGRRAPAGSAAAGSPAEVECAPFARALTGVSLAGDAADWWQQAAGRYAREQVPEIGSLLVFRGSARLPAGHVAVVSAVVGPREILVTQANWVHHRIGQDQPVVDVSADGSWSRVRVWWPPAGRLGVGEYATFGFIRPPWPTSHGQLLANTPTAIRTAEGSR